MPCKNIYSLAAVLVLSVFYLGMQDVHAETIYTVLYLDRLPSQLQIGEQAVFSGRLMSADQRYVISDAVIYIKDDDSFGPDDLIARAITDDNGRFAVSVTVRDWDEFSPTVEIYAVYEGSGEIRKARSATQNVQVTTTRSHDGGSSAYTDRPTRLTISSSAQSIHAGNPVTFSGRLTTSDGSGIADKIILIKEHDPFLPDEFLSYGTTDRNGYYSIRWVASAGLVERDFDVYAVYEGDLYYERARTATLQLPVLKYSGSITLDRIPSSANVGDAVVFSGRLALEAHDPTNAIVYIKDEDTLNPDDLLATAYVDRNGEFVVNWIVRNVDDDSIADIYAVFEGSDTQYRLTTCDRGPTFDFGGICANTQKLYIGSGFVPSDPAYGTGEYMELAYALPLVENPRVAIVPSPDSYDAVRGHIVPVQEGIIVWKGMLEAQYGGDWDVDFEVVTPGKRFAESRPDVVINLVTGDEDAGCVDQYLGWARMQNIIRPIQVHVCSDDGQTRRSNAVVSFTAAHEFIHAMGVGHTFNRAGDMMCSYEEGYGWTCPGSFRQSYVPSDLNLGAVVELYGRDGFKVPNNAYHSRIFSLDGDLEVPGAGYTYEPPPEPEPEPEPESCDGIDYSINWDIDKFALDSGWYRWWTICSAGSIHYSFSTDSEYDGYLVYVLPPGTDVQDYVDNGSGYHYECEGHGERWHRFSTTCNIAYGSTIVLHNDGSDTIRIYGKIQD